MAGTSFLPPGGLMEIVFSFDTTGSMSSILDEVRARVQDMIQRLQADIPGIRMGIIAHGDYCDKDVYYLTQQHDLSNNMPDLIEFLKNVGGTGGGDPDECYELVLKKVREEYSWNAASQKILVLIGDANPHEPDYDLNTENLDWREETKKLANMGIKIYGVQAFENEGVEDFYKTLALETCGHFLKLGQFSNICDFLMAICYRERDETLFMGYEAEVRSRGGAVNKELNNLFGALRKTDSNVSMPSTTDVPALVSPLPSTPTAARRLPKLTKNKRTRIAKSKKVITKPVMSSGSKILVLQKEKRPRETVPQTKFTCNVLNWSKWELAYTKYSDDTPSNGFRKVGQFLRKQKLFYSSKMCQLHVYEIAVQTRKFGKRNVLYTKTISGPFKSTNWENEILFGGRQRLRKQIHKIVELGCKVFIRRALVLKQDISVLDSISNYDYAWSKQRLSKKQRHLVVKGVELSHSQMEE